jgi:hypothetical protein
MNGTRPALNDEQIQKVLDIINNTKDAILSGWQKCVKVTGKTDLLAVLEPDDDTCSILILPREAGLSFLSEKGADMTHPGLQRLNEAAVGLTPEATAIWVVIRLDGNDHVTKIVNQPMSQGGSA